MVIVYKELKNNKVTFLGDEFEILLEKARLEGYKEGYVAGVKCVTGGGNAPTIQNDSKITWQN